MLARVASLRQWLPRRWLYLSMSILTLGAILLGQPQMSQSADLLQLLLRGAQIAQLSNMNDAPGICAGSTNQSIDPQSGQDFSKSSAH